MNIKISSNAALHEKGGRFKNEDFIYPPVGPLRPLDNLPTELPEVPGLYVVCDGVGGEKKGEIASRLAASELVRYFHDHPPEGQVSYTYLNAALYRVEEAFSQYIRDHSDSMGMATTLTVLYVDDYGVMIGWIGDSRVYHLRGNEILYKTSDHSLVNRMVRDGEITAEEALRHPQRNVVLRVISGTEHPADMDTHYVSINELEHGDIFVLCTDGVLEEVSDSDLVTMVENDLDPEEIAREISSLSEGHASDNYSCYVVKVGEVSASAASSTAAAMTAAAEEDVVITDDDVLEPPENSETRPSDPEEQQEFVSMLDRLQDQERKNRSTTDPAKSSAGKVEPEPVTTSREATSASLGQEEGKTSDTKQQTGTRKSDQEEAPKGSSAWVPILMVAGLLLIAFAIIWLARRDTPVKAYAEAIEDARDAYEEGEPDRADSLLTVARQFAQEIGNQPRRQEAMQEIEGQREAWTRQLAPVEPLDEAENTAVVYTGEKMQDYEYAGLLKAKQLFEGILNNPAYELSEEDRERIQNRLDKVNARTAEISETRKFDDLIAYGRKLCQEEQYGEAKEYLDAARAFASEKTRLDRYAAAKADCSRPLAANTQSRSLDGNQGGNVAAEGEMTDGDAETGSLAALDPNSRSGENVPASAEGGISGPTASNTTARRAPTSTSDNTGSSANTSINESLAPANARVARTSSPTTSPYTPAATAQQRSLLERGKKLFEKSRLTGSKYEEQKAREYLLASGPALDPVGAYYLANIYNNGHSIERDTEKATEYAQKSALGGHPGGHFVYADLLLENQNSRDSVTAMQSLNIAALQEFEPAIERLLFLQTYKAMRARLRGN